MSAKQLAWALRQKGLKPTERVVLMILADRSDADGWSYYSQETIAAKAEVTRKTVRGALQELETMGLIRRSKRCVGNLRTSDHVQISLGKNFHQSGKKLPTIPTTPYGVSKDREERASRSVELRVVGGTASDHFPEPAGEVLAHG